MKTKNKLEIVNIFESVFFRNDDEFDDEDKKYDYYWSEFWVDCDYIIKKGKVLECIAIDNEIITNEDDDYFLTGEDEKMIKAFYDDKKFNNNVEKYGFEELSTWGFDIDESSKKMEKASLAIKYRGGQGYNYGWWILKN